MYIEIQFNKKIIDKIKSLHFQVDQLGSILFILFALYEGKIELLDEFDDANKQRRAIMLYKELVLKELLVDSEDDTIFVLTRKGIELIEFIKANSSEITTEKIAVQGVAQLKEAIGTQDDVDLWIGEWLDLFPAGIKTFGKLVKGDKPGCARKMRIFLKEYGYNKDIIMQATKAYVDSKALEGYQFMRCAVYFIYRVETSMKDRVSDLSAWCEQVVDEPTSPENTFEVLA